MESNSNSWWELHLRKARGETLSAREQKQYESELASHDQQASIQDLEHLKQLRAHVASSEKENAQLRKRIAELENEIQTIEMALQQKTRALLGVPE